jgi:hypothetical protein
MNRVWNVVLAAAAIGGATVRQAKAIGRGERWQRAKGGFAMKTRFSMSILAVALAFASVTHAAVLFSENFSGATPGNYVGTVAIGGTGFQQVGHSVDVLGDLNGSLFGCFEINNNCIDMVGTGPGNIQSNATFNLIAGNTYDLTFRTSATGSPSGLTFLSRVSLGSQVLNFSDVQGSAANPVTARSLSFVLGANETGKIIFEAMNAPGPGFWGAALDDVVLTETSASSSGVPEPASILFVGGGIVALAWRRRRVAGPAESVADRRSC